LNVFDGYNSFIGYGGNHLDEVDAEENSGAGGAGVNNNSSSRVGKGGNGGCIIEYEGSDRIEIYAENYLFIQRGNNEIVFLIYDNSKGERDFKVTLDEGIYPLGYLVNVIQYILNTTTYASVRIKDHFLEIRMIDIYSIDLAKSSSSLLINLGITTKDIYKDNAKVKSSIVEGVYQLKFTNPITSVCKLNLFDKYQLFE
jgi:hypothetical protein